MSKEKVASHLLDAALQLEGFAQDLREIFQVEGANFVEPPLTDAWDSHTVAKTDRASTPGRLWKVMCAIDSALREMDFRIWGKALPEGQVAVWTNLVGNEWSVSPEWRDLCGTLLRRGRAVAERNSAYATINVVVKGVPMLVIPCEAEAWALRLAAGFRKDADNLTPANGSARKTALLVTDGDRKPPPAAEGTHLPPASSGTRREVVVVGNAAPTERNIRLARTRTAYLEAHGNVPAALRALKAGGHKVGKSTFYNHLHALDQDNPGWRNGAM